jgi:hypothetical protein
VTPFPTDRQTVGEPTATLGGWIDQALDNRLLQRAMATPRRSVDLMGQASAHVESAREISGDDPTMALTACDNAVRKAIDAHAGARGFGFGVRADAHPHRFAYAEHELVPRITRSDVTLAGTLCRRRQAAECGDVASTEISARELATYIALADRVTMAVRCSLPDIVARRG